MEENQDENTVLINGKLYSAETGEPIEQAPSSPPPKPAAAAEPPKPTASAPSLDGFSRPSGRSMPAGAQSVHKQPAVPEAKRQPAPPVASASAQDTSPQVPESAQLTREQRAQLHQRSELISKYAVPNPPAQPPTPVPDLPVSPPPPTPPPAPEPPLPAPPPPAAVDLPPEITPVAAAPLQMPQPAARAEPEPARRGLFGRLRPRTASVMATALALLLLGGYVTYLNIPNLAMRVAASRAGFSASLPDYKPAGFKFSGPIAYSTGQITVSFKSNSDDRAFTLTQRQTTWDSASLLENHVVRESQSHSTIEDRGLTIYVFDSNKGRSAAWVNGGIWYSLEGIALLNQEQITKIAASL